MIDKKMKKLVDILDQFPDINTFFSRHCCNDWVVSFIIKGDGAPSPTGWKSTKIISQAAEAYSYTFCGNVILELWKNPQKCEYDDDETGDAFDYNAFALYGLDADIEIFYEYLEMYLQNKV